MERSRNEQNIVNRTLVRRHYVFRDHDSGEVVFECDSNTARGAKKQFWYWKAKNKQI